METYSSTDSSTSRDEGSSNTKGKRHEDNNDPEDRTKRMRVGELINQPEKSSKQAEETRDNENENQNQNQNHTELVARHYNSRPDLGRKGREESRILHMKNFNNWVKSVLIHKHCPEYASVFDICSGKGGDLLKWTNKRVRTLVLADVAHNSVVDALKRFNNLRSPPMSAMFVSGDCFKAGLTDRLPKQLYFDFVSCQFSLHYSFETEAKARGLLQNISGRLKPGGRFVGTIPNANWIVKKLQQAPDKTFGNDIYSITFEQKDQFPRFGAKYFFTLEDSVDNCPEFLVHFATFEKLAAEYQLRLVYKSDFHGFYEDHKKEHAYQQLLYKMNVFNEDGTLSDMEWEASGIYMAFVFQKEGHNNSLPNKQTPSFFGRPRAVSEKEILMFS